MACSLSHTDSKIEALVQKLIDEDKGRQNAIMDLALQFENLCTAKDDLRNAYEKCNDISQESGAWIDSFLKEGSAKDYELNLSMYGKATKLEKQMDANARVEPSPYTLNPVTIIPDPAGIVQLSSSTCVEPSSLTPNPVRIIPGPAGVVQHAKLLRENVFILDSDGALMSTQQYMQKFVEDVGEDTDFNSEAWFNATNYVIATGGTVTGCLGDINNFLKKKNLSKFNPLTPEKPPMPPIFSYPTVKESVEEHDTCDEYLTEGFLIKKEQQQLAQDEEAYKEYLEEEAKAEKERARA
nr:hypothetical protein [Tanacetum cinerariifolium]